VISHAGAEADTVGALELELAIVAAAASPTSPTKGSTPKLDPRAT
jgi:hypothetical protein